jgi:hypothetical protein
MRSKQAWRRFGLFLVASIAVAAAIASAAVVSQADHKTKYDVDATALAATVKTSGSRSVVAGYVTGDPFGKSAVILKDKSTVNPDGTAKADGKFTVYNKRGSVSGTVEATATPHPGADTTFDGEGKITSGTGKFKGSKGDVNITGSYNSSTGVLTLHATGSVKY